ncbi:MAG: hypothetical protein M3O36_03960 [Myxococcota bacterium]|nr:hypothetical protein [Myxococcota bacterium]
MNSVEQGLVRIRCLAGSAERRLRLDRALRLGARALCIALLGAIADVALRKVGAVGEGWARAGLALSAAGFGAGVLVAWRWRLPERAGARAIDRFHGLHDRLASALTFAALPEGARTPFMHAAIDDAIRALPAVRPARAVPLVVPRALFAAFGLAAVLAGSLLFEIRHHVFVATAHKIDPVDVEPDDLDEVNDFLKQAAQRDTGDDTRRAIDEFNTLVADISNERLDRTEAFRRMQALEEKLLTGSQADKKTLEAQLDRIAEELKKAELTMPAGEALAERKFEQARDKLHELAKKLRERPESVDKSKLDQLREALKTAAASAENRREELQHRRQELAEEILKRKQRAGDSGSDEERSLLEKKQRELERMDRELDQQKNAEQGLDRLDRELAQAAEDLMKDLGLSAQDLDQGAEDLNRMQQQQMTEEEKQELRQKLQELRELVRQQGSGGKGQRVRLQRFARAAHGQGASGRQGGVTQGPAGDGDGSEGEEQGSQGQHGEGRDDPGQGGQGPQAQGGSKNGSQGSEGGETWVLGPNREKMLMLSKGRATNGGGGQDRGDGSGGEGQGRGGHRWGDGHDPNIQGNATNPKMGTEDTQVHADDTGQGGSRSQVILGAAERGFVSHGYKRVFVEYHQVAEESLAKDDIPGGYRFYVKRYFQLIRPRDGQ